MNENAVINYLMKKKVFTVDQLALRLDRSIPTCRRRLKTWNALASYNQNGRYYTLPSIPDFDCHGLWQHRGIRFSSHGNLKRTLVHHITISRQGLSASEIGQLLAMRPQSFLSHYQNLPAICREKIEGRFIWFAADEDIRIKQKQNREHQPIIKSVRMPSDIEAVMILLDLIHHPQCRIEDIGRRLRKKDVRVDRQVIRQFLFSHDLLKKTVEINSSQD